jgi:hypothetical protein
MSITGRLAAKSKAGDNRKAKQKGPEAAMITTARLSFLFLVFLLTAVSAADDAAKTEGPDTFQRQDIPLENIWAYQMPGTHILSADRTGPERKFVSEEEGPLVEEVVRALVPARNVESKRSGFAVTGTGLAALNEAHFCLAEKQQARLAFPTDREISLVVFSELADRYFYVEHVRREGLKIKVEYRLVPHAEKVLSQHFAIVPVGSLPAGRYRVEMMQLPMRQSEIDAGFEPAIDTYSSRIACQPFSFLVRDEEPPKNIPLSDVWAYNMSGTRELTDVMGANQEFITPEGEMVRDIRRALSEKPPQAQAQRGFVVEGTGLDALREAHARLVKKEKPKALPPDTDLSIVFFAHRTGVNVQLHDVRVERGGEVFVVRYQFVPHDEKYVSEHFALIPIGKLPENKFVVGIQQYPMEPKYAREGCPAISLEVAQQIVCPGFQFKTRQLPSPANK